MKILHSSDLHGGFKKLLRTAIEFDVWVDSGDFFPNKTRGDISVEPVWQKKWAVWKGVGPRLCDWLKGRPLVCIGGNHDYTDLAAIVRSAGGTAFNLADGPVTIGGKTFAGFRDIPYIAGEWAGETHEFSGLVAEAMACDPDFLVTHAPPAGILDTNGTHPCGIKPLTAHLSYAPHRVVAHMFGHIHTQGGSVVSEMGITFSNAATGINPLGFE